VTSDEPDAATSTGSDPRGLLVPPGTCLVHIGPPKTGTTAVQGAMHEARPSLHAQGVHYAGNVRHSGKAVHAVTGRAGFFTDGEVVPIREWHRLVKDTRRPANERVVLSSEFFADADPADIDRILTDIGRERVHVVITLRPLLKIMPSQWQQYVQSGMRRGLNSWLDGLLGGETSTVTPTFWRRHRHDELVARWAAAVGTDRVTVVAVDDRDHNMLMRTFEQLTGLREGTLIAKRDVLNRSMSLPEIEAVRALNKAIAKEGLPRSLQSRLVHFGAGRFLTSTDLSPDEQRVLLPRWAAERAAEISLEMTAAIAASGVRVVGDLDRLNVPVGDPPEEVPETVDIPPDVAARLAMGVIHASGASRRRALGSGAPAAELPQVAATSSAELARVIARRGQAASVRRVRRARERLPGGDPSS
jgi:hypothetical protein